VLPVVKSVLVLSHAKLTIIKKIQIFTYYISINDKIQRSFVIYTDVEYLTDKS